ncbi:hypothetical protein [Nesterenkonia rhizosphaerae]|uniref:Uncharacterized protein n=1 Tax=Nesterenkonia rhizosphaerae TaxID=1348272 RepID=A0ABP9G052_9MICC
MRIPRFNKPPKSEKAFRVTAIGPTGLGVIWIAHEKIVGDIWLTDSRQGREFGGHPELGRFLAMVNLNDEALMHSHPTMMHFDDRDAAMGWLIKRVTAEVKSAWAEEAGRRATREQDREALFKDLNESGSVEVSSTLAQRLHSAEKTAITSNGTSTATGTPQQISAKALSRLRSMIDALHAEVGLTAQEIAPHRWLLVRDEHRAAQITMEMDSSRSDGYLKAELDFLVWESALQQWLLDHRVDPGISTQGIHPDSGNYFNETFLRISKWHRRASESAAMRHPERFDSTLIASTKHSSTTRPQ